MNSSDLTINVVHTPNYGVELLDNKRLLTQLSELITKGVKVNILINGKTDKELPIVDGAKHVSLAERVPLGRARYLLHKEVQTTWYMNIDEDDSFVTIESWFEELLQNLSWIETPTVFCKYYVAWDSQKVDLYPEVSSLKLGPIKNEFTQVNCACLFNKEKLGEEFYRPFVNYMEDNLFWAYLCSEHKDTTFMNLPIQIYDRSNSLMSKDSFIPNRELPTEEIAMEFLIYGLRMNLVKMIDHGQPVNEFKQA